MVQPIPVNLPRPRRKTALALGLFLFSVYLLFYRGGFHSVDEVSMFAVTESMVKFGRVNTNQIAWTQWTTTEAEAQGFFGLNGAVYSKKGLALSVAQAPLYWLALVLPGLGMLQTVSILNALITAASGALVFMAVNRLRYPAGVAIAVALAYGLATIALVYAKYLFSEPLAGLLLLLAAYLLLAYRQEGGVWRAALAGLAASMAVLARANNLFLLPVFGLYLLGVIWQREHQKANQRISESTNQRISESADPATIHRTARPFATPRDNSQFAIRNSQFAILISPAAFILAAVLPGFILMAYNAARSGNALQTGYDLTLFSPNFLLGLYKLLFSPLRGLFVYSPILLASLPGWRQLRRQHPAEAWLCAGLVGVTVGLFSAWSSGEGLSWGSRFLVPVAPFLALALAPVFAGAAGVKRAMVAALLALSIGIQVLGAVVNPWVFLAKIQTDFGGEFFLENTAALTSFRYSQIAGQIQNWSLSHSDLAWWQPWGFDGLALGLSVALVLLAGWLLRRAAAEKNIPARSLWGVAVAAIFITCALLARYNTTDRQFGPPDDPYTQALHAAAAQAAPGDMLLTVAQEHYHVPMNRFKPAIPLTGFAQQNWPPPATALPLLQNALGGQNIWLITVNFTPAAPNNATERWLVKNSFKATDAWFGHARLVRFGVKPPTATRTVDAVLGESIRLAHVSLTDPARAGQVLPVTFTWQPFTPVAANVNVFLQLLDAAGLPAAQHDNPPGGGYNPPLTWIAGHTVVSRHGLALPPELPAGPYRLIAGLYAPATGQRLPTDTGTDFVDLGLVTIITGK